MKKQKHKRLSDLLFVSRLQNDKSIKQPLRQLLCILLTFNLHKNPMKQVLLLFLILTRKRMPKEIESQVQDHTTCKPRWQDLN